MNAKKQVNRMITDFLKKIASEDTEMVQIKGEDILVTKAEALARLMWRMALGFEETKVTTEGPKTTMHNPDKGMMGTIIDRVEGRAVPTVITGKGGRTVTDKISEQGKSRISEAGGIVNDD